MPEQTAPSRTSFSRLLPTLLLLLTVFGPISMDLYLPALPALTLELDATTSVAQLTVTACLIGLAAGLVILVPVAVGVGVSVGAGVLLGILAFVAILYVYTKFSLTVPVIVIEEVMNPLRALGRSWSLTKGNSVRLFLFYVLIFIVFFVVSMVLGIVGSMIGMVGGTDASIVVNGLIGAAANMVGITLYLAVLASVHRQLSGGAKEVGATFE